MRMLCEALYNIELICSVVRAVGVIEDVRHLFRSSYALWPYIMYIVASELKDPICHSNECQIGSFSSRATIYTCMQELLPEDHAWEGEDANCLRYFLCDR